jgi:hypothetical protein
LQFDALITCDSKVVCGVVRDLFRGVFPGVFPGVFRRAHALKTGEGGRGLGEYKYAVTGRKVYHTLLERFKAITHANHNPKKSQTQTTMAPIDTSAYYAGLTKRDGTTTVGEAMKAHATTTRKRPVHLVSDTDGEDESYVPDSQVWTDEDFAAADAAAAAAQIAAATAAAAAAATEGEKQSNGEPTKSASSNGDDKSMPDSVRAMMTLVNNCKNQDELNQIIAHRVAHGLDLATGTPLDLRGKRKASTTTETSATPPKKRRVALVAPGPSHAEDNVEAERVANAGAVAQAMVAGAPRTVGGAHSTHTGAQAQAASAPTATTVKADSGTTNNDERTPTTAEEMEESPLAAAVRMLPYFMDAEGKEMVYLTQCVERASLLSTYLRIRDWFNVRWQNPLHPTVQHLLDMVDKALLQGPVNDESAPKSVIKPTLVSTDLSKKVYHHNPYRGYKPLKINIEINHQWSVRVYPDEGRRTKFRQFDDPAPTIALVRLPSDPTKSNEFKWYIPPSKLVNVIEVVEGVADSWQNGEEPTMENLMNTLKIADDGTEELSFLPLKRPGYEHAEYESFPLNAIVGLFAFTARSKGGDVVTDPTRRDMSNVRESMRLTRKTSYFENDGLVEKSSDITFPTEFIKHLLTTLKYVRDRLNDVVV